MAVLVNQTHTHVLDLFQIKYLLQVLEISIGKELL